MRKVREEVRQLLHCKCFLSLRLMRPYLRLARSWAGLTSCPAPCVAMVETSLWIGDRRCAKLKSDVFSDQECRYILHYCIKAIGRFSKDVVGGSDMLAWKYRLAC